MSDSRCFVLSEDESRAKMAVKMLWRSGMHIRSRNCQHVVQKEHVEAVLLNRIRFSSNE